jgi:hypothetical protein
VAVGLGLGDDLRADDGPAAWLVLDVTGWPSNALSFSATIRAEVSVEPPGA